jgi:fructose-1-phosphate kinase PfkB-like protein
MSNISAKFIIVLGPNPAWQKTLFFKELVTGEVNRAYDMNSFPSGKGINFSRAASIWGKSHTLLLQFAGGYTGKLICDGLDAEGIRHSTISVDHVTRTCTTCLCQTTTRMTELIEPSHAADQGSISKMLDVIHANIKNCLGIALCGTLPGGDGLNLYIEAAQIAETYGIPLLIDSWQDIEQVLQHAGNAILKINLAELRQITGIDSPREATLAALNNYRLKAVAITDGPGNAYAATADKFYVYKLKKLDHIVNPLGSGDTADAVFFSEYLNEKPLSEAFASGLAAASANCLTPLCGHFELPTALQIRNEITISEQ